jgi:hypothetical protein
MVIALEFCISGELGAHPIDRWLFLRHYPKRRHTGERNDFPIWHRLRSANHAFIPDCARAFWLLRCLGFGLSSCHFHRCLSTTGDALQTPLQLLSGKSSGRRRREPVALAA